MTIRVTLHGNLRRYIRNKQEKIGLETDVPVSLRDLLQQLEIPEEEVFTVSINGNLAQETQQIVPGDDVDIFGPIAGG